jgi:hypothetical protein
MIKSRMFKYITIIIILFTSKHKILGQKNIYISRGNYKELEFNRYLSTLGIGILFNGIKPVLIGGEICSFKFWDNNYSSIGIGLCPIIQLQLMKLNKNKLFFESKGGVMYMFPEYSNTAINYNLSLSPVYEIQLLEKHKLRFGVAFRHSSNGKRKEQFTNQMWDGIGFSSGWIFN